MICCKELHHFPSNNSFLVTYWWWVESNSIRPCGHPWLDHVQVNSRERISSRKYHRKWIGFVQRFWVNVQTSLVVHVKREHGRPLNTISRCGSEFPEIRFNSPTKPTHLPWWRWSLTSRPTQELSIKGT